MNKSGQDGALRPEADPQPRPEPDPEANMAAGMVERVALAIWTSTYPGDEWSDIGRQDHMDMARAAIEAMREPTQAMCQAGQGWDGIARCYQRMITAALR